jgi:hypothetical protein
VFKRDREIVFPFSVSGRAGIVRDHRWTALRKGSSRCASEQRRNR